MPRALRKSSSTGIYHVVIKGANGHLLFEECRDYKKYLDYLEYYKSQFSFKIYAYCLMSNHIHLLVHIHSESLSDIFHRINTSYAIWFNNKYDRTGFLQDGRFHSEPVESLQYLFSVVRYIHKNPFKAGLEPQLGANYKWSSFLDYQTQSHHLVDIDYIFGVFGGYENFMHFHNNSSSDECLDVDKTRKRITDYDAQKIIYEVCQCKSFADFEKLSIIDRNKYINELLMNGLSERQLSRLSGFSRGLIRKIKTGTYKA